MAPAGAWLAATLALVALALRWQARDAAGTTEVVMVPVAAFGILLASCSLLLIRSSRDPSWKRIGGLAGIAVAALGLMIAGQYAAQWRPGTSGATLIDWSGHWWAQRPGPMTGVGLAFIGTSLAVLGLGRGRRWVDIGASVTLALALTGLIGHAYGASALYGLNPWGGTATSTAVALGALALGTLFAEPTRGVAAVILSDSSGGQLLRRLLPAALLAPLLIGWLAVAAQKAELVDPAFGTALLVVALVVLLMAYVVRQGRSVHAVHAQREHLLAREREVSDRVTNILESITDAFFAVDRSWRFTYVNREAERLLRRPRGELLGRNLWEEFPAAIGATFQREYQRAMTEQKTVQFEEHYPPLDAWFEVKAYSAADGLSVYFHDVTARRLAEQRIRESEERFRSLAENATMAIFVIDESSTVEFANPAVERIFGYARTEMVGRSLGMLMPQDQRPLHAAGMRHYLASGRRNIPWEGVELPGLTKDGRVIPLEISMGEFVLEGRHYFTGIARDISERKRTEAALRESEARHRLLADMIPQHIWTTDPDGYHNYFSRRWYEYTGCSPEQARGEGWLALLHPDDRERTVARWQHSLRTGEPYAIEYRFRSARGDYHWFLGQAMPLRNEAGAIVRWFGTLTDITDRKQAEEAMRESEERFRALANSLPQLAWMADPTGWIYWYNDRWHEYTGTTLEQMQGWNWRAVHHPDHVDRVVRKIRHAFETGELWEDTFPLRSRTGEYRWFLSRALPIRDAAGEVVRWLGTNTDITDQIEAAAERERLLRLEQEARAEADRRRVELERVTESRTRLMRGFSHDVRNPLGVVDAQAMLLEDGRLFGPLNDKQRESVQRIRRSVRASLALIEDLLELARAEAGHIEVSGVETDVAQVAREVAEDFRAHAISVGLALEVRAPEGLRTETDPARVRQVLANLLSNAVKYAPRGQVTVEAAARQAGGPRPGEWIAVCVADTGPGIPPDKRERIFQEFTRLDPQAQQGAGIGLAISRRIARLLGGDLTVESEPDRGAVFTLWLPAASAAGGPVSAAPV